MNESHVRKVRFAYDEWKISETAFTPADYRLLEALLALSNGYLGQRSSFEEGISGVESLPGNYIAGVFDAYPNATMIVMKGRPSHPTEIINAPDHLPVRILLNGQPVDLAHCRIESYARTLHMDTGVLTRDVVCEVPGVGRARIEFLRFLPRARKHLAVTRVKVTPLDFDATVTFVSEINGDVRNARQEYLTAHAPLAEDGWHGLRCRTKTTDIEIVTLASESLREDEDMVVLDQTERASAQQFTAACSIGKTLTFEKIVAVANSRDADVRGDVFNAADGFLADGIDLGVERLLHEQQQAWAEIWRGIAIDIKDRSGSAELTQGLHYSLFQMIQNAPNDDYTVNLGAKGLTGEHYAGLYFWDTEVFMLPMFAFTLPAVARDLVKSRAHYLPGARRKATEVGLHGAMYPWQSDADGNESCTLWQFGLLGIHVTADVAWSVWFYYCTSGDLDFIAESGIDIMVETSRFWASRVFYRQEWDQYTINRVLGPDEYHQGVDNHFYTNMMVQENLLKTLRLLEILQAERPAAYATAVKRLGLRDAETAHFREIAGKMCLPRDEKLGVNMQDDRFHLLEPYDLKANPPTGSLLATWSYDRIMRAQLLRQADIVVAHLLLGDRFTPEDMRRDFDYYEPKTTHDSSLSFCSYAIIAAALRKAGMAYDYFLRTARLDLDDIHGNSWMGVHTACLAGAWQCVVLGFGGARWYDGRLSLDPLLPDQWEEYTFSLCWHGAVLNVKVTDGAVEIRTDGAPVNLRLGARQITAGPTAQRFAHATRVGVGV